MKRVLGVIPARGGSKGVPYKNIKLLNHLPLIAYSIACCKHSKKLTEYVVSTDDEKIKQVALTYGAPVIDRPSHTATDDAPTEPCLQDAVNQLKEKGKEFDAIAIVQITCPFRLSQDIDDAIDLWDEQECSSVMSVSEVPGHYHPYWQKQIDENGRLTSWFTDPDVPEGILEIRKYFRRQDLPGKSYWKNGAIYIIRTEVLMDQNNRFGRDCRALMIDSDRLVNIDTEKDFEQAQKMLSSEKIKLDFQL